MAFCSTTLSLPLQIEGIKSIKLSLSDNNSSTEDNFLNHQRRSVYTIKVLYTWYLFMEVQQFVVQKTDQSCYIRALRLHFNIRLFIAELKIYCLLYPFNQISVQNIFDRPINIHKEQVSSLTHQPFLPNFSTSFVCWACLSILLRGLYICLHF